MLSSSRMTNLINIATKRQKTNASEKQMSKSYNISDPNNDIGNIQKPSPAPAPTPAKKKKSEDEIASAAFPGLPSPKAPLVSHQKNQNTKIQNVKTHDFQNTNR